MYIFWIVTLFGISSVAKTGSIRTQKLIVKGVGISIEQYPYVAQLVINRVSICGGAVISSRIIITAGHCVYDPKIPKLVDPENVDVYLGSSKSMKGTLYEVCRVIKHEMHGVAKKNYFYDLAMILLTKRIVFGPTVKKVTIPRFSTWRNIKNSMTIAGYGRYDNSMDIGNSLRATRMQYVNPRLCGSSQSGDGEWMPIPVHMFCMIGSTWTSDCNGDSGSPITWRQYIVGLVSFGRDISCGSEMMPSMYTDLTFFRGWVQKKTIELESISTKTCKSEHGRSNNKTRKLKHHMHVCS